MKPFILIVLSVLTLVAKGQNNLPFYITAAKQNNPLISDNKNQSQANQLEINRFKAFYTKPQIGITANYLFSPIISTDNNKTSFLPNAEGATNYYGYDLAYSNGGQYSAMVNVTQPLFNGQRYKTATDQLNVTSQINENNAKLGEHDIEKIVGDQYILCLQDNKQIAFAEEMVKLLTGQKNVLKKLVENSIYKQSDLTLLNIELQNFVALLTTYKANYQRDLMDLNIICGINDTTLVQLEKSNLTLNNNIDNSNFLEKFRLDSLNLAAQQKAFELKYKPQLNLFANTGLNAVYAPSILRRIGISAGLSFTYYFFDGKQKAINRNKTLVLEKTVSFYKDNFVTQNTVRKVKILTEIQSYNDRIAIAEKQLKDFDLLLNSYKNEILSGQLSIINYTMVLKNMATVQRDYTLLFSQQQSLINTCNYWNW